MADPLSMGASIIAFIEITNRIVSTCKYCIETIKDAPNDFQMILGETKSLQAITDTLNASGAELTGLSITLEACRKCLSELERLLPTPRKNDASSSKSRKITFTELAWPLKESRARKLLSDVSKHKATLLLAISGDMAHDIQAIRAGVNNIEESLSVTERLHISKWLEIINPSIIHNQTRKKHDEQTTSWLLRSPEWNNWLSLINTNDRFLWCFGIPGCGKTVMASFINEQLKRHCVGQEGVAHAYYYCHYSHNQEESIPFLRWTTSQACRLAQWVPPQLKHLHDGGCEPTVAELNDTLATVLSMFKTFYIVVDAIDESSPRKDLINLLAAIALDQRFRNVRLLVTSRQYSDIENVFSGISVPLSMSNDMVSEDIRQFIQNRLANSRCIQKWPKLTGIIEKSLVSGARGMFRWVECQIYAIECLRTESQIREALRNLPRDLAETYIRIFQQIPEADRPFVRRVLIWLGGHVGVPYPYNGSYGIKGDVLTSAASHDLCMSGLECDPTFYDIEYLRELVGCLIIISSDVLEPDEGGGRRGVWDPYTYRETSTVTLAHYTVMEFLASPFIGETDASYFALPMTTINAEFTKSVLRQAVHADPQGTGNSWLRDREAYCLTIVPDLAIHLNMNDKWPDLDDLFLRYCDPRSPHYSRILRVQDFITQYPGHHDFAINRMPRYQLQGHPTPETAGEASILLTLLMRFMDYYSSESPVRTLLERSPDLGQLLTTRLTVTCRRWPDDAPGTGSVLGILFHDGAYVGKLGPIFSRLLENYSRHFNATEILVESVNSRCAERIFNVLIKHGADPNGLGCFLTPLKASIYLYHKFPSVTRLLLEAGANPSFVGSFLGEAQQGDLPQWMYTSATTPLALIQLLKKGDGMGELKYSRVEKLLLEYGAVL